MAGAPYDTLEEVIGLRGSPRHGSLKEFGVSYRELPVSICHFFFLFNFALTSNDNVRDTEVAATWKHALATIATSKVSYWRDVSFVTKSPVISIYYLISVQFWCCSLWYFSTVAWRWRAWLACTGDGYKARNAMCTYPTFMWLFLAEDLNCCWNWTCHHHNQGKWPVLDQRSCCKTNAAFIVCIWMYISVYLLDGCSNLKMWPSGDL